MTNTIIVLIGVIIAFAFLWKVFPKKTEESDEVVTYHCSECNENDCKCYEVEKTDGNDKDENDER